MSSSYIKSITCILLFVAVFAGACEKQTTYEGSPVSLTVVNGMNDGIYLYSNFSDQHPIGYMNGLSFANGSAIATAFENPSVRARFFASPDTLAKDQPLIEQQLSFEKGKIYSLYLMGDRTAADHLVVENKVAAYKPGDSVTYLQIVNISNDQPVSVNLKGEANGSLVGNLAYKATTDFFELKVDRTVPTYEFEFRDAATGDLLFTNIVPFINPGPEERHRFLYRNWTLVFRGKRGESGVNALKAQSVFYQ